ncbi:MAG: vWA domain-containing protein [Pseudomonadota bacterium]|nr:vWA domain-containing protein [Pseudomonadota bacterium]
MNVREVTRRALLGLLSASLILAATASATVTGGNKPLLMEGKKSLYQRVLAEPSARLYTRPGGNAQFIQPVTPFTIFYVYDRVNASGKDWLRVGVDKHDGAQGWVRSDDVIEWRQSLTVAFKDPLGQDRVLLFRDRNSLKSLISSRDLFGYSLLYDKASKGEISTESPIISIQPKAYVDIQEDFYLVPITQYEDVFIGNEQGRMLRIASVPAGEGQVSAGGVDTGEDVGAYRAGMVFVVDSTVSMGPYIDRTRQAVSKIYRSIEAQGLNEKVSFGVVAYRDNIDVAPGLEYLTRTYATLDEGIDPEGFFERVNQVQPARVSSQGFIEDAYAGVKQAIEGIDWSGYEARYVVLITDAGARPGHDPLGSTGMNADALQQLAQDKGVAIWVLHLETPPGRANHDSAAAQYAKLSFYPGIGELYYPVGMGSVAGFGKALDSFASKITTQVADATRGKTPVFARTGGDDPLDEFQRKVDTLGYALRMRYLQKAEGGKAPEVFNAWLIDRDIADPSRQSVEVRVLLTRDQLSDLQAVLKKVLVAAEEGVFSPNDFLQELQSIAASVSRDPTATAASTRVSGSASKNLADLGYMREYIEDLPYRGEVMDVSLEDWENWSAKQQLEFIHRLEAKVNYYQAIHDNTDLWISLDHGPVTGDSVYPVALKMLP